MIKLRNIKNKNGHKNCHNKDSFTRSIRLVGNGKRRDRGTYFYGGTKGQETKVSRRLGIRKAQKKRRIQKSLEYQMAICERQLRRLDRLCLVQANESTIANRKRFFERRYMRLRRKANRG